MLRQPVSRGAHWSTTEIQYVSQSMAIRFPTAPNLGTSGRKVLCKTTAAPEKSHFVTQAGDTLKKLAMLTKRTAIFAASHFVTVFRVAVNRNLGRDRAPK